MLCAFTAACSSEAERPGTNGDPPLAHALFVAHEGSLVSYDIATGEERPGAVQNVTGPVDLQALEDGTLIVNLTGRNEVLIVDGKTMLEIARVPSSATGGKRPVHSYITPEHGGKSYWITLNDGESGMPATNTAQFIDVTPESPTTSRPSARWRSGSGTTRRPSARRASASSSAISPTATTCSPCMTSPTWQIQKPW